MGTTQEIQGFCAKNTQRKMCQRVPITKKRTLGLYAESHGIVADAMYDAEKRDLFLGAPTAGSSVPWSHWWEGAEPIWLLAERRRLRSAVYWWPGCEVALNETRPAICMPQRPVQGWRALDSDFRRKLDEVLEVFDTDELSLAMLQYGAVAYFGTPSCVPVCVRPPRIREFDHHLNYLIDRLEILNLTQKVTLMVVSDHGMANTGPESTTEIVLDKYSSFIKYMLNFGSHSMVLPWKDMFRPLHRALIDARVEGLQVYTKEEIPAREDNLAGFFKLLSNHFTTACRFLPVTGIKRNYVLKPLVNVDHYNFMCHALGLEPKPNNGSWARMDEGLVESEMDFPRYGSSKYSNAAEPTGSLTRRPLASWPPALELLALVAAAIVAPACARHAL
ncbi:hypothetical protein HPB48_012368 [Haemaphysalis longicornis]|uniref:glycerophosphocholine cholinephosphodiesterase n=1 Tax=Haemaphysalis longicornis TaxID=44386 RepID=A0A9J6G4D2_HAELO|nr:hypothetical protein HPB48_012368 [Haemaphysalis longicornis]